MLPDAHRRHDQQASQRGMCGKNQPLLRIKHSYQHKFVIVFVPAPYLEMMNVPANLQVKNDDKENAGQKFNPEVAHREGCAAGTAATAQQPITYERYIVLPADRLATLAAAGGGPDQTAALRQTHDADIEETPDGAAEQEQHAEKKHDPHDEQHAVIVAAKDRDFTAEHAESAERKS